MSDGNSKKNKVFHFLYFKQVIFLIEILTLVSLQLFDSALMVKEDGYQMVQYQE